MREVLRHTFKVLQGVGYEPQSFKSKKAKNLTFSNHGYLAPMVGAHSYFVDNIFTDTVRSFIQCAFPTVSQPFVSL